MKYVISSVEHFNELQVDTTDCRKSIDKSLCIVEVADDNDTYDRDEECEVYCHAEAIRVLNDPMKENIWY
jgi:hypothetical protein